MTDQPGGDEQGPDPLGVGDAVPAAAAPLCDGETFRERALSAVLPDGGVVVFTGFAFAAPARNWWRHCYGAGYHEFDVPVVGASRDGPYARNRFLRHLDSPFRLFADVDGAVADAFGLLYDRAEMGLTDARRAVYVDDDDQDVTFAWTAEDWVTRIPNDEVRAAVADLPSV